MNLLDAKLYSKSAVLLYSLGIVGKSTKQKISQWNRSKRRGWEKDKSWKYVSKPYKKRRIETNKLIRSFTWYLQ